VKEPSAVGKLITLNEWDEGVDLIIILDNKHSFVVDASEDRIGVQGVIRMRALKDDY